MTQRGTFGNGPVQRELVRVVVLFGEAGLICNTCNRAVPDGLLACPNCANRKNIEAMWAFQRTPLQNVVEGYLLLKTRVINGAKHIAVFGPFWQTFCGEPVERHHKSGDMDPRNLDDSGICEKCRGEVRTRMNEARPAA